jgi:hypothetical protein
VWAKTEYGKLRDYDGEIAAQAVAGATAPFHCHSSPEKLCSGWLGHRDHPADLLAVRLGYLSGCVSKAALDYATDVPLFASGAEAAAHGEENIENPGSAAEEAIRKIVTLRDAIGEPVGFG